MNYLEKITILIHTRNRPWFLIRLINHYNKHLNSDGITIIILDGSDEHYYSIISNEFYKNNYPSNIRLIHHSHSTSIAYRLYDVLPIISTPYILLAADDDLYFFDWLKPAVDLLDSDNSYGTVYGHTVRFELEHDEPYGKLVRFGFYQSNPPARWLENGTPQERLNELGKSDWATTGWYALQRTELLSIITKYAKKHQLDGYSFERLLIFCQAALSKTKKIDAICLARQISSEIRPLYSFKEENESITMLKIACANILTQHQKIELKSAISMVEDVFRAEVYALKKNDSRRYLRAIADRFPLLRELKFSTYRLLRRKYPKLDPFLPDMRFPLLPNIDLSHPIINDIIDAVSKDDHT